VIGGAAFGAETLALPRPSSADLLAVQADRWLVRHRLMRSIQHLGGAVTIRTACMQTWLGPTAGIRERSPGEILATSDGGRFVLVRGNVFRVGPRLVSVGAPWAAARFRLGCPRLLGKELGDALEARLPIRVFHTNQRGRPALELWLRTRVQQLELFVDVRTFQPLAVRLTTPLVTGWSTLQPGSFGLADKLVRRFRSVTEPGTARRVRA
jgi:hypothetical protein